jgi:hypothetical protein
MELPRGVHLAREVECASERVGCANSLQIGEIAEVAEFVHHGQGRKSDYSRVSSARSLSRGRSRCSARTFGSRPAPRAFTSLEAYGSPSRHDR